MDPNNRERSERAQELMVVYSDMVGGSPPDMDECAIDLLADLMHSLGRRRVVKAFRIALSHHESERRRPNSSERANYAERVECIQLANALTEATL